MFTSEIFNAEVLFREDCSPDEFIDVIVGNRVYMPCLYVSISETACLLPHRAAPFFSEGNTGSSWFLKRERFGV